MGRQLFWGSLMKPQILLITLAWVALLLYVFYAYDLYKQAPPQFKVPAKIQLGCPLIKAISSLCTLFVNLPRACYQRTTSSDGMKYGDLNVEKEPIAQNSGSEYEPPRYKEQNDNYAVKQLDAPNNNDPLPPLVGFKQQEASMLHFYYSVLTAPKGSPEQERAQRRLDKELSHRAHVDCVMVEIGKAIFNTDDYYERMMAVRSPVVDDWDCYKTMVDTYETHCELLTTYASTYVKAFANMCNVGILPPQLATVASQVCADVGKIIPECKGK